MQHVYLIFGIVLISCGCIEARRVSNYNPKYNYEESTYNTRETSSYSEESAEEPTFNRRTNPSYYQAKLYSAGEKPNHKVVSPENDYLVIVPASILQSLGFDINAILGVLDQKEDTNEEDEDVITVSDLLDALVGNSEKNKTQSETGKPVVGKESSTKTPILEASLPTTTIEPNLATMDGEPTTTTVPILTPQLRSQESAARNRATSSTQLAKALLEIGKFSETGSSQSECAKKLRLIKSIIMESGKDEDEEEEKYHITSNRHRSALSDAELERLARRQGVHNSKMEKVRFYVIPKEQYEAENGKHKLDRKMKRRINGMYL